MDPEKSSDKLGRLVGRLALALAIVGATWIAASSWVRVKSRDVHSIDVTGSAKRRIVSDLIQWRAVISTEDPDRTAAFRTLRGHVEKTLAYVKAQGLADPELSVGSVAVQEVLDTELVGSGEDRVERTVHKGWRTTQVILVSSQQVEKVERISREVTGLLEQGVPVTSGTPAYFYTKLGELKIEMLAEASRDARVRAEKILKAAGNAGVGKLRRADMGVINVNPANSTSTSWDGNNDTSSLDKDIITIVHCTFDID